MKAYVHGWYDIKNRAGKDYSLGRESSPCLPYDMDSILLCLLAQCRLALLGLILFFDLGLDACQFAVDDDTSTVLTHDDLLAHADIQLTLRWNLIVASST